MKLIKSYENFKYDVRNYRVCDIFSGDKRRICLNISYLKNWITYDLGLREVVDELRNEYLKLTKSLKDKNLEYQIPLSYLYEKQESEKINFGIEKRQSSEGVIYYTPKFDNQSYVEEKGKWHFINKLNTNYLDLTELLTEVIYQLNIDVTSGDIKEILLENKERIHNFIKSNFDINKLKEYVRNTKRNTEIGNIYEDYAKSILSKIELVDKKMEILYRGSDGDLVDMIFGVDIITRWGDRIITCQVKSDKKASESSLKMYKYHRVDYFISPVNGLKEGIIIYNKLGETFIVNNDGEIIR